MSSFRYVPPGESAQRQRATSPARSAPVRQADLPSAALRNVESVLSLGDTRYITYRDHTYRIPPVPFKLGQRVLDSHIRALAHAKQVAMTGDKAPTIAYYRELAKLARLLWTHVRPLGPIRRACWRIGLLRNPFASASEGEMKAITDFFLQGRMMSSVRSMSAAEAHA